MDIERDIRQALAEGSGLLHRRGQVETDRFKAVLFARAPGIARLVSDHHGPGRSVNIFVGTDIPGWDEHFL